MGRRRLLTLVAVITLAIIGISILLIATHTKYFFMPRHPPPSYTALPGISYGSLSCNNHFIIIPGNSMVVLRYHVHGNVAINGVVIYMAFPAGIINESLAALSKLPNLNDALIMGVYINGKLIASTNNPGPIQGLEFAVSHSNGPISVGYTSDGVFFPTINLTSGDVITVVIYSAVPYALPSCAVANESEETGLMVRNNWIGVMGIVNGTPTAEQLYEEGRYITEEPVIYIINTTSPMNQLPQELTPGPLAEARPIATGYAPSFTMGAPLTNNG
ncbi:hypothetical protein [Vulcanisaeta sp. JCM 14467]